MKIAIIGAGVSGLTAAYLSCKEHEVTVYEKSDRVGGHAHTLYVDHDGKSVPVDNGFMVFNPKRYPYFCRLLEELDIDSVPTRMSLSATIPGEISYRGTFPKGLFLNPDNIFRLRYWRFLLGVVKFRNAAKKFLLDPDPELTLGEFIESNKISADTVNWAIIPVLSAVWSISDVSRVYKFPALSTFVFLDNHHILDAIHEKWRTIPGGSIRYVTSLSDYLKSNSTAILTTQNITAVDRSKQGVTITSNGEKKSFDAVIFATHANVTKSLISDILPNESEALSMFSYTSNATTLHSDKSIVGIKDGLMSSWNYRLTKNGGMFSYCMNILQHIDKNLPLFVTLNATKKPKNVHAQEVYEHPQYNLGSLEGQRMIQSLQGQKNTYYAGAHLGYGFHEDGVASAIRALKAMGVALRWQK